jgi:hypothetical protein
MIMKDFKGPGFSMKAPTDWYITSTPQIQAMFISPIHEDGIQANLIITMNPVEAGAQIGAVAEETRKHQTAQYKQYQILDEGPIEEIKDHGFRRIYTCFNENKNLVVRQIQIMLLVNDMLYVLTTTRPVVDEETEIIKQLDATLEYMLESFSLD